MNCLLLLFFELIVFLLFDFFGMGWGGGVKSVIYTIYIRLVCRA